MRQVNGQNVQANNYWSSSTYAGNTTNAWNVNMNDGNMNANNKTNNNYVWPVRGGEWLPLFSFENLYKRYLECRRNKRNTVNALAFEKVLGQRRRDRFMKCGDGDESVGHRVPSV